MKRINVFVDDKQANKNGEYTVYLSITDERYNRIRIRTGLYSKSKFDGREFPNTETAHSAKTRRLNDLFGQVEDFMLRHDEMPLSELKTAIMKMLGMKQRTVHVKTIADYVREYADMQKESTRKLYSLTSDRMEEYDAKVVPDGLSKAWLDGFEKFLRDDKGLSVNGIAQKMRNIRTVMNWCIDEGITQNYPFRGRKGYRIKEEVTVVNDLTAQEFADIRDYPCEPWQEIYRDMFCLSVYLAGINAGDLLLCKGLTKGRMVFVRRKTDKKNANKVEPVSLPVYPEAKAIIDKYKGKDYLLRVMDCMTDYHTFVQHWNKALKKIGTHETVPDKVGKMRKVVYHPLFPNITTYTSRYTFASVAANDLDISENTIGKCLGHAWSKEVTARYISNDQKKIDNAVRRVIDYLNGFKGRY